MYSSISVKKQFNAADEARPISHIAAATIPITSCLAVHFGAESALHDAPELVWATTGAMIAFEWLQWTSLGRIAKLHDAGHDKRADALKWQSAAIGGLQVVLYTVAVVGYAAKTGANWAQGWPLVGSIAIAAIYACLNFGVKWTSCEAVEAAGARTSSGPNGGTRKSIDEAVFGAPQAEDPIPTRAADVLQLRDRVRREASRRVLNEMRANAADETSSRAPDAAPRRKPATGASQAGRDLAMKRWAAG